MIAMHVGVMELLRLSSCEAEYFNIKPGAGRVSLMLVVSHAQSWRSSQMNGGIEANRRWS